MKGWKDLLPKGHKLVKVKYGAMVTEPYNLQVAQESLTKCSNCGAPAGQVVGPFGWIRTACPEHTLEGELPTSVQVKQTEGGEGWSWTIAHLIDRNHPHRNRG